MAQKSTEFSVQQRGQFNRMVTMGFYIGAAQLAAETLADASDAVRNRTKHICEAMDAALQAKCLKEAAEIAAAYPEEITDEQRTALGDLVPSIG